MDDSKTAIRGRTRGGPTVGPLPRSVQCPIAPSRSSPPTLAEARVYCRRLTRKHYENFTVASCLLPRRLRPHFYHVYAYCRWADDLADETGSPAESLALLDWWEDQLGACYEGRAEHPVFVALQQTIRQFDIPAEPFRQLLVAFRQDQTCACYESIDQLLGYCRHSANPVGRLVLYLGRCHDERRGVLADAVCTGLQLANLWQDLARDVARGRVYLPAAVRRQHGYSETMLAGRETNDAFRAMMRAEVDRAEALLKRGRPLADMVPTELQRQVALYIGGGLEVLGGIRRIGYDVWWSRPVVGRGAKLRLLLRSWWGGKPKTQSGVVS